MSDVIVIGGGFAGLAAGVALAAEGVRVTVLEKRPFLGGRAYSYTDAATGETIDNGQHAMMGCYHHMFRFLERIGASDKLAIQSGLRVPMLDAERGRGVITCPALPNPLHMAAGVLGYRLLDLGDRARVLVGGLRLLAMKRRCDPRLATLTVDAVLDLLRQPQATRRAFWYPVAIATLNEDPALASADLLAEVMVRAFFSGKENARFVLARVGLSDLYTVDARRFIEERGGRVETKAHVVGIGVRAGEVTHLELRDGRRMTAHAYVSAVPPQGLFPILPLAIRRDLPALGAIERLASSPIVSVHVWFDRPLLRDDFIGFVGTQTHWCFNRDKITGRDPRGGSYLTFVSSGARAIVDLEADAIVAATLADVRHLLPGAAAATVRHTQVVKEKFATMSPTIEAERLRPTAATPLPNFFLAGDWTATGLPATIESAVQSGHRAAELAARCAAQGVRREEARAAS
ncbi:MAG: FAD-dependent oxidoreductase [Deltaproteobacteria bacterium]|nr:FAD-dependent oxidoreductase [Deltaproteobacteria bacterium]